MAKKDASSAKRLALGFHLLGKPLMEVRKRSVPEMEHLGTPARTGLQNQVCPFKRTLAIIFKKIIRFTQDIQRIELMQ